MFASSIQIVTLFAFIAHAVLGCCWHHSHAAVNLTTQAAAEAHQLDCSASTTEDATADGGCGHRRAERAHSHCSHRHAAKACDAAQNSSGQLVKQGCCSSSHQSSDHCTTSRCSYISAKLLTLDLPLAASLEGFVADGDPQRQLPMVHANGHLGQRPFFSSPQCSGELCVYLQTWQI